MDDILEQLNNTIKSNTPIINDNTNIIFGEKQYPINGQVKFQSSTLTLGQVWICLKCINDDYSVYLKQCKEANLNPVNIGIKNLLKSYFNVQDTSLFKTSTTGEVKQTKRKRESTNDDDKKRLKPFDYTKITIPEKEFGEKEQESKLEFIKFLSNSLTDDISNVNTEPFLPYLEFDRPQVLNYINNKEIPFSTRITQTQIEREFVDKKGENTKQLSYFTSYLENIKRCKTHFTQHKKDEKQKRIEREQLAKQQGYSQENAKLNLKIKGTFNERNLWNSEFGNEDIMNEIQIDTTGSMMMKSDPVLEPLSSGNNTSAPPSTTNNTFSTNIDETIKKSVPSTSKQVKKPLPIILLPPGRSSLLTLYNIKDFLQRGAFVSTDEKKKNIDPTTPKPKEVIIKHAKTGTQYLVLDTTKNLHKNDWERVVAIFTIGQLWQFKDSNNWFSTDPSIIFSKKKGFTLAYEGEALPQNTQNWNVEKLYISRLDSKRHTDSTVARKFWSSLGME
ncbi:predicted protein [Naegleria gruberi]|uniref:Predicted protein n=1 Tax=Naegleria gruberi TaxID=5762 RepID=D2UXU8_NAEGR|nr:uncharacterized protein NAEGRDRAFT_61248 [Naegleria gruberi]EFC50692.1 predicted protein [Naegleria gruberi]|eukprot:XP_002683436.1 predicted protein [Naegleria gruberi strain NEG-M]